MIGGTGIDNLTYGSAYSYTGVSIDLATGAASGGDAQGDTIAGFENLTGSWGDDNLAGNADANAIDGYYGDDDIFGGAGNDTLKGSDGDDYIVGGANDDVLYGGFSDADIMGGDTFRFDAGPSDHGNDTIMDFQVGVDFLEFSGISAVSELSIAQMGTNALISYNDYAGSITLLNVDVSRLSLSDYSFV